MVKKSVKLAPLGTDNSHTVSSRIREQAKLFLARKIQAWLIDNRMTPADLARKSGLPRDSISRYMLKKSLPTEESVRDLAKAMDCQPSDLMPNRSEILVDADNPTLEMIMSKEQPGKAWLRLNQLMSIDTAQKIIALLQANNDASDGKRGR